MLHHRGQYFSCIASVKLLQVLTIDSHFPVKPSMLICLPSVAMKKIKVKLVERKLQNLVLSATERVVFPRTLFCTQCPNISRNFRTQFTYHNAMKHSALRSDVIFKCTRCYEECQHFTLSKNIKILRIVFRLIQQMLIGMISSTKLMIRFLKRSCDFSTFSRKVPT